MNHYEFFYNFPISYICSTIINIILRPMTKLTFLSSMLLLVVTACSSGSSNSETTPTTPVATKVPISLSCGINSRATDTGFDTNDKIGLFVVNYNNGASSALKLTGNYVDNMRFTYSGKW